MTFSPTVAFIFNASGSQFLTFYAIAFFIALLWSLQRGRSALASLNPPPGVTPSLENPIEIAYLAGGAPRCAEVALVNLIEKGILTWNAPRFLKKGTLVASKPIMSDAHWFERGLYSSVVAKGSAGLSLRDLTDSIRQNSTSVAVRLASLGLRPTYSDRKGKGLTSILPLTFLFFIGLIRLGQGFFLNKPIGFLIAFTVITVITMSIVATNLKKLTPAGEKLLLELRGGRTMTSERGLVGVALFGITGATAYADMQVFTTSLITEMRYENQQTTRTNGCGGGGCGGGGCGGGGCGGCGGCG